MATHPLWFSSPLADFATTTELDGFSVPPFAPRHAFDAEAVHELFHEQTKYHRRTHAGMSRTIRSFLQDPGLIARGAAGYKDLSDLPAVELPEPLDQTLSLAEALSRRRSTPRQQLGGAITAAQLSAVLNLAARVNRTACPDNAPGVQQTFRPYPSAGGLFPIELYVVASRVTGLPSGVFHYDARGHVLRTLSDAAASAVHAAETSPGPAGAAPVAFVATAVFERSVQKYGVRGYRLALLEAGHLMQNIVLVAGSLGLPSLVSASFYEAEVEEAIGADGVSEAALAMLFVGGTE